MVVEGFDEGLGGGVEFEGGGVNGLLREMGG